jgi:hypothetical protein
LQSFVIASVSEAIQNSSEEDWIASSYAQKRFGGLQARHSSHSERRRVVASAPLRKRFAFVAGNDAIQHSLMWYRHHERA